MTEHQSELNYNIAINSDKGKATAKGNEDIERQQREEEAKKAPEQPEQASKGGLSQMIKNAAHPGVCIVTIMFKAVAIASFIILDLVVDSEALAYLIVILLSSADFWVTKNISGRLLVGLRWWNEVREDGNEVWIFESKNEKKESTADKSIFWSSLYIHLTCWLVLFAWEIISLKFVWAVIALLCLVLAATNVYGYVKCSKEQQNNIVKVGAKTVMKAANKGVNLAQEQQQQK